MLAHLNGVKQPAATIKLINVGIDNQELPTTALSCLSSAYKRLNSVFSALRNDEESIPLKLYISRLPPE